ncbi:MAG: tripartite tricarboxylate transporter TctB family protein [Synergistetes bacterium]|nr:MAG: Uncharacterized protein XD52_0823 [bacterium 42_11]MBC7330951.1 tripartite tricarboxylate transporter TctB family protein [Synergistota bacterium]
MDYVRFLDFATLVVMFIANFLIFYNIYTFNKFENIPVLDVNSPLIFPFLIALTLLILLVSIIVTHFRFWREYEVDKETHLEEVRDFKNVVLYFVVLLVYVMVVEKLHFKLTTFVFALGAMYVFSLKEYKAGFLKRVGVMAVVSLCLVYVIEFVFYRIFLVNLP